MNLDLQSKLPIRSTSLIIDAYEPLILALVVKLDTTIDIMVIARTQWVEIDT